uniref:Uncharacterized protein n=1 Tax=Haptolina brevifila TaxID=156173 RepID=A0A7S2G5I9_9EUKA
MAAVQEAEKKDEENGKSDAHMAFDVSMRGMLRMVDESLSKFEKELQLSDSPIDSGRFYYRKVGSIDVAHLMKLMGCKGKPEKHPSLNYEIGYWEKGLIDEDTECYYDYSQTLDSYCRWMGKDVPHFLAKDAFIMTGGKVDETKNKGIREETEEIPGRPFKLPDGTVVKRNIEIRADWVKYIRRRFEKKADKVLQYMLSLKKELIEQTYHGGANYSMPILLWDKQNHKEASPEQKMALLMRGMNLRHERKLTTAVAEQATAAVTAPDKELEMAKQWAGMQAEAAKSANKATSLECLVEEKYSGKSFDDKDNNLLHWVPPQLWQALTLYLSKS